MPINCQLSAVTFPPDTQPIACRCSCNSQVAIAAQTASCHCPFSPHTTNYLLFPSLFPPHNQLPVVTVATAKWPLLPSQLHAAVTFPPHSQMPIVSQSLSPLTTNCLLLPLQQPGGYCCPASFMPAENWAIGIVKLLGCLAGRR